jgi:hypothetical protein
MATALLATACGGGGGGGDAAPAVAPPPAGGTPQPAGDVAIAADLAACPTSEANIGSNNWHTVCLVGKRLVGKDPITSEACELRFKPNGVFEYAKNGVVISTTPPFSQWQESYGQYLNFLSSGGKRFFKASLDGRTPSNNSSVADIIYKIELEIEIAGPSTLGKDIRAVAFSGPNVITENCRLSI